VSKGIDNILTFNFINAILVLENKYYYAIFMA